MPSWRSAFRERDGLLDDDSAIVPVRAVDTKSDRFLRWAGRTKRSRNLDREPHPVFERSAIIVGPEIDQRRKNELIR
jgi:hypothetical protein